MNYEEWHKEYMEKKIINLKNELNEKDIEVLSKLDIEVQDKIYTQYDFEIFMINVGAYDRDDTMSELDLEYAKDLNSTGVSRKEYKKMQDKVDKIYDKYCKYFAKMYSNAS